MFSHGVEMHNSAWQYDRNKTAAGRLCVQFSLLLTGVIDELMTRIAPYRAR